ncbi:MAG: hypothetical protein COA78_17235 [Blastopirellula sp.]|nr:MAG: hypothetical protein COA78_17235 [Blastopirellula sp.]
MPTLNIEGQRVNVDDAFLSMTPEQQNATVEEIAGSLGQKAPTPNEETPTQDWGVLSATTEGTWAGLMGGFDDEIGAGMLAPIEATKNYFQGNGFDLGDAYTSLQQRMDADKAQRREQHPVASTAGEVVGGLTMAGGAAAKGATIAAKGLLPAMAESGLYGTVYGAGEAKPGERAEGAVEGALWAAGTGGLVHKVGGVIAKHATAKASKMAAPAVEELAQASKELYDRANAAGVTIKTKAMRRLGKNILLAAGRNNEKLRPKTAGIVEELAAMMKKPVSLEQFDEFRQQVSLAMKSVEPADMRRLTLIKKQMDNFADNVKPVDVSGKAEGFALIKEARGIWARKSKTEMIEEIFDLAELDLSQYTQSGFANTLTKRFRALAKKIRTDKKIAAMFSAEERKQINTIAMGGTSSKVKRLMAKFAPRGVVSTVLSGLGGHALMGPAGLALPLAGHIAAKSADKAAIAASRTLSENVARGHSIPQIANRIAKYAPGVGGVVSGQIANRR